MADGPTIGLGGPVSPHVQLTIPKGAMALDTIGQAFTDTAKTLGVSADQAEAHANQFQALNNKAAADEATANYLQQANELQYGQDGLTTKRGQDAMDAYPEFVQKVSNLRETMSGTLGNPMAKAMFDQDTRRQLSYSISDMSRYASQQRQQYITQANAARIKGLTDSATLQYKDPAQFEESLNQITEGLMFQGSREGWDDETLRQNVANAHSTVYMNVIETIAQTDPIAARQYFEQHSDEMTAAQRLTVDKFTNSAEKPQLAASIVDNLIHGSDSLAPQAKIALHGPGLKADPVGTLSQIAGGKVTITSGERTPQHNAAVGGTSTSEHQSANFAAGYGAWDFKVQGVDNLTAVQRIVQSGMPFDQLIEEGNHIHVGLGPKMRQEVLQKQGSKYVDLHVDRGGTQFADATDVDSQQSGLMDRARALAASARPGDAQFQDQVESTLNAQLNRQKTHLLAADQDVKGRLLSSVIGGADGSGPKPITMSDLQKAYPGAAQDLAALKPQDQLAIQRLVDQNAHPTPRQMTPADEQKYYALQGMAHEKPDEFAKQNILGMNLPASWTNKLMDLQMKVRGGKQAYAQLSPAMSMANSYLKQAGITQSADNVQDYNAFKGKMLDSLETYVSLYGKQPTSHDIISLTQNLLRETGSKGLMGMGGKTHVYDAADPATMVQGVPNSAVRDIISEGRGRGLRLTPAQVQQIYRANANG